MTIIKIKIEIKKYILIKKENKENYPTKQPDTTFASAKELGIEK